MISCPACALPGPTGRALCAFCETTMLSAGPALCRLVKAGHEYTLLADERVLASAADKNEWALIRMVGGAEYSLVSFIDAGGCDTVLLDDASNVVFSVSPASDGAPAQLLDSRDELIAVVRSDGCGGLHALTAAGEVLVYLGRNTAQSNVVDVLITDAGHAQPLLALFALMVTLKTRQSHLFSA